MNLHRVKQGQDLKWPAALVEIPETSTLTRLGRVNFRNRNRVVRATAGFVIDMDAPGEAFFCGGHNGVLVSVPMAERAEAMKEIEAQGPIDYQPAIDYLEELGEVVAVARPEAAEAPVDAVPLGKLKADPLKAICDKLAIPHAKVGVMRKAIAEAADCKLTDVVLIDEDGDVAVTREEQGA